jgi:hypothetical protein
MVHISRAKLLGLLLLIVAVSLLSGCAAGNPRFTVETPAGFWQGLWHGMISGITFIINLFKHDVKVYEVNNNGGWYNFGFLLGVIGVWGGGSGVGWRFRKWRHRREWEDVAEKVERKVMQRLKEWAEPEDREEWEELKRKIREWAEEE